MQRYAKKNVKSYARRFVRKMVKRYVRENIETYVSRKVSKNASVRKNVRRYVRKLKVMPEDLSERMSKICQKEHASENCVPATAHPRDF